MPVADEAEAVAVLLPAAEAARATVAPWEAGQADGGLCCPPLHSVAGLAVVGGAGGPGAPLRVLPEFDPPARAAAARRRGAGGPPAALVSLVPTMLGRLLDAEPEAAACFAH